MKMTADLSMERFPSKASNTSCATRAHAHTHRTPCHQRLRHAALAGITLAAASQDHELQQPRQAVATASSSSSSSSSSSQPALYASILAKHQCPSQQTPPPPARPAARRSLSCPHTAEPVGCCHGTCAAHAEQAACGARVQQALAGLESPILSLSHCAHAVTFTLTLSSRTEQMLTAMTLASRVALGASETPDAPTPGTTPGTHQHPPHTRYAPTPTPGTRLRLSCLAALLGARKGSAPGARGAPSRVPCIAPAA